MGPDRRECLNGPGTPAGTRDWWEACHQVRQATNPQSASMDGAILFPKEGEADRGLILFSSSLTTWPDKLSWQSWCMRWVVDGWTGCMAISIMPPSRKRIIWFLSSKIKQKTSHSTHTVKLIDEKTINFSPPPWNIKAMMEYQTEIFKKEEGKQIIAEHHCQLMVFYQKFRVPAVTIFKSISNIKLRVEETWTHANWWLKHHEVLSPSNTKLKVCMWPPPN